MKEKPKPNKGDVAHTIAKAGLSAIPVVGGPAVELFNAIITPPLAKRRDEWIESIAEGLKKLEETVEGFKIENLKDNDMFITTVMHATQVAIRNHQKEKLDALRTAILNSTSPNAPEEDMQLIFLNFVDILTSSHLKMLKFLENPIELSKKYELPPNSQDEIYGIPYEALNDNFPELQDNYGVFEMIIDDLELKQLLIEGESNCPWPCASQLGKEFLQFITSPIEDEEESK